MKFFFFIALALLTACDTTPLKQEDFIPPLVKVVDLIKEGMSYSEVNSALAGHKPAVQFTDNSSSVWEIQERNFDLKTNSTHANRLAIVFNNQGKVSHKITSFCFLPDQEPPTESAPTTNCYQEHLFPFDKKLTYDAIKRLLIISNYQIDHSDAASELISATGTHRVKDDDDKMMFIKLSIVFSSKDEHTTDVVMSASFSVSEKQSTWVQAGFAGVTLPVPLPFQHTEEWVDTGIVTPKFYLVFYDALNNLIAKEYLPYTPVIQDANSSILKKPNTKIINTKPPIKQMVNTNSEINFDSKKTYPVDNFLDNLKGPIDGALKIKSKKKSNIKIDDEGISDPKEPSEILNKLNGQPIDK